MYMYVCMHVLECTCSSSLTLHVEHMCYEDSTKLACRLQTHCTDSDMIVSNKFLVNYHTFSAGCLYYVLAVPLALIRTCSSA